MVTIQEANIAQAEEIADVVRQSVLFEHPKVYPEDKIQNVLSIYTPEKIEGYINDGKYYVAMEDNKVVGCVFTGKESEMDSLYVLPEYMRKGIGSMLAEKAEQRIKELGYDHVWIWASLLAVDFYKSRGYVQESDITDKNGNTWYLGMRKRF